MVGLTGLDWCPTKHRICGVPYDDRVAWADVAALEISFSSTTFINNHVHVLPRLHRLHIPGCHDGRNNNPAQDDPEIHWNHCSPSPHLNASQCVLPQDLHPMSTLAHKCGVRWREEIAAPLDPDTAVVLLCVT